jgi:hypothetical protein
VSLWGKSVGGAERYLLGPEHLVLSHHEVKLVAVTHKNGHPTINVAFTQVGAERWDVLTTIIFGVRDISVPIIEPQDTASRNFDRQLEIVGGSLIAAEAHQFASSL